MHHKEILLWEFFLSLYWKKKVWSLSKFLLGKNNFFVHSKLVKVFSFFNIEDEESKLKQRSVPAVYIEMGFK